MTHEEAIARCSNHDSPEHFDLWADGIATLADCTEEEIDAIYEKETK